jgi:alpha-L-fucosidase 2
MKKVLPGFLCAIFLSTILANPVSGQHLLWYDQPAEKWVEALPVGNGSLGAMIYGKVNNEQIVLNEESVWTGQPVDRQMPDAGKYLPKARELLFNGEYKKAEQLVKDKIMSEPIDGHSYQVLGDLELSFSHNNSKISDYRRELDLKEAIARVSYQADGVQHQREIFSSPVDNSLIVLLSSNEEGSVSFSAKLTRPKDVNIQADDSGTIVMNGQVTGGDAETHGQHPGVHYETQLRIKQSGGNLRAAGNSLIVENADQATLFLVASTDYWGEDPHTVSQKEMDEVFQKSYEQIKKDHITEHQRLYDRAEIDLGSSDKSNVPTDRRLQLVKEGGTDRDLVELYFNYGRYLLISSSRPGDLAANLQGIWAEGLTPPWNADYHININIQMNYWPAEVTNLAETHYPFFALIDSLRPRGRITAKNIYDSRGFVAHHTTDAWYWTVPIGEPRWGMWPMGAAWSTQHYWEHYLFNQDTTFLEERGYPVMKEASLFFVDYLVEDPKTGYLVSGPSNSPENSFITADGEEAHLTMGPTMDMQIIGNLLSNTIEASKILDRDAAFRDTLKQIKEQLRPLEIADDGRLMEWAEDFEEAEPGHRHISHLFALHPGNQISMQKTPELAEAARKTINYRLEHGGGHTGWSRVWIINFFARLHDVQRAYENVLALLRKSTLPNLFDTHPPFQIDGNFGGTAGIAEMLIQSHADEISRLPALPDAWSEGSVKGFRARGGYDVDFSWKDEKVVDAEIIATQSRTCRVRTNSNLKVYSDGKEISVDKDKDVLEFEVQAGQIYTLR